MKIRNYIVATLALISFVGCTQEEVSNSPTIRFSVGGSGLDVSTRGIITQELVNDATVPVRVTASKGTTSIYNNEQLFRNAETSEWLPIAAQQKDWETGIRHTFSANAYSPSTAISSGGLELNSATNIVVTQPATYDTESKESMIDYLLSQTFAYTVPENSRPPIVKLEMEHAVSLVEVNIAKHVSFELVDVFLDELRLEGFYRSAVMECPSPAQYGNANGETNADMWQYTVSGTKDASYVIAGASPIPAVNSGCVPLALRTDEGGVRMSFLAVPQQLESSCFLTVSFWVNEKYDASSPDNFVRHEHTFKMFDYETAEGAAIWLPGHHVVYTLEVDTGIHIEGTIKPWIDVDYIEGTVLPDIVANNADLN